MSNPSGKPVPAAPPPAPQKGAPVAVPLSAAWALDRTLMAPSVSPMPRGLLDDANVVPAALTPAIPTSLREELQALEDWALGNKKDARNDAIRFWVLKIPAIGASAAAGIFAFYKWEIAPLIAGAIASACVLIDGLNPGGALRNAHYKAFYEIRDLEAAMVREWRVESYKATTPQEQKALASKIIKDSETRRDRISNELKKAETALGKAD